MIHEKQIEILISIRKNPSVGFYKHSLLTKITYSHVSNAIKKFKLLKIVKVTKKGRQNYVNLTAKGEKVADLYSKIKMILK